MTEETENKTERVQLLMTPSEVKAIDDWGFENRIRTRAEAIRRLCQMGIIADETPLMQLAMHLISHFIDDTKLDDKALAEMRSGAPLELDIKRLCWAIFEERSKMGGFRSDDVPEAMEAAKRLAADYRRMEQEAGADLHIPPRKND
ncbi:hypothetical protein [Pelagibacterium sediminicola]|uniref:hypothetical protein n=1 Tax=Pelagibacterium sediminicola TaxID=2248761 RepID=UPI000E31CE82|nr:hypothetical protein [Pelagibacterium sediminicola]